MGALTDLRESNRLRILDVLRRWGSGTRAEIVEATGLSRTTVTTLLGELQRQGMVVPDGRTNGGRSARGRPPAVLRLQPAAGGVVGVDFGRAHIRVALADLAGSVLAERCLPVDVAGAPTEALESAAQLVKSLLAQVGLPLTRLVGAGIGLPGPVNPRTSVVGQSSVLTAWIGRAPAQELADRLGVPVAADNDANLGALAESFLGAARGMEDFIYLKAASGIGAGLVVGGALHHGATGIAGEIGHVNMQPDGAVCRCGGRGCLETVASSSALPAALAAVLGPRSDLDTALELASQGHPGVCRVIRDAGRAIGRATADLCNALNPEAIVVGGELSRAGDALLGGIQEALDRYALPTIARSIRLAVGSLGERAEVLGALKLALGDLADLAPASRLCASSPDGDGAKDFTYSVQGVAKKS